MAETKKTPWEAYSETASDPFGRSMLGQHLHDKEIRLKEQIDRNEEQAYWDSFINQGGSQQGEEIPNPDVMDKVLDEGVSDMGFTKYIFAQPNMNLTNTLLSKVPKSKAISKAFPKIGAKLGAKAGLKFIPGIGWAMAAADAIDYFGYPIYDHIPGGEYMTWRNTSEGEK